MKKRLWLAVLLIMAVITACSFTASADVDMLYAMEDGVRVYESKNVDSEILQTLYAGQQVMVETYSSNGVWAGIICPDYRGDGQQLGWVKMMHMSYTVPPAVCDHNWSAWTVTIEPTCTRSGMEERFCSICGAAEALDLEMLPHSFGNWTVTREATCTQEGLRTLRCSECGYEQQETIERLPHTFGDWVVTKTATCTAEGERLHRCRVCGYEERQTLEKLPHSYGDWTVLKQATCTAEGERTHICRICGYESRETVEKLPHEFKWEILTEATDHSAGIRTNVCQKCGYTEEKVSYDPEGTLRRGDQSEQVREVQQLLADQNYLNVEGADGIFGGGTERAIMEFQNDQGLTADGVAWPQTIARLHHDFGEWTTVKKLTRDAAGERVRKCKECNYEQHEVIEPEPGLERGRRSEDVRAVQQMLTALGYDAGVHDGIYGQMLDAAFGRFAGEKKLDFEPGKIYPAGIDALVNAWIATLSEENWMGESGLEAQVNLVLTVTPVEDEAEDDGSGLKTYTWTLTNMGSEDCLFMSLLLNFGSEPDFRKDNLVMYLDGMQLRANCANGASGSFAVEDDWGEGERNFAALGVSESSGKVWLSNVNVVVDISE